MEKAPRVQVRPCPSRGAAALYHLLTQCHSCLLLFFSRSWLQDRISLSTLVSELTTSHSMHSGAGVVARVEDPAGMGGSSTYFSWGFCCCSFILITFLLTSVHVCVHAHVHACGDQRTNLGSQFFPPFESWEANSGSQACSKHFYPLSHLAGH